MRISLTTWGGYYATDYDISLSVHTYDGASFTTVACAEYPWAQPLVFDAAAWTTYYIMASAWGPGGNLYLSAQEIPLPPPPPANDDFATPAWIGELPYDTELDTSGATTAGDDPYCSGNGATVWYAFTPTAGLRVEADTIGSSYDTTLSVYTDISGSLEQLACNDDWYGLQSYVTLDVNAGQTYYFMVAAYGDGTGGAMELHVEEAYIPPPPPNDDIYNATPITALPFSETVDATYATWSGDDPPCGWYPSLWYTFTPDRDMRLESEIDNYAYISVNTGSPGNLTQLVCQDQWSPLRLDVQAGVTYYIMLSVPPYYGNITNFTLREAPPPLSVTVTVNPTATFDPKTGTATVSGTLTCSRPASGYVYVFLRQPVGRVNIIQGGAWVDLTCDGTTTWTATVVPTNGKFAGGQAEATVNAFVQEGYDGATAELVVPLTLNRAKK